MHWEKLLMGQSVGRVGLSVGSVCRQQDHGRLEEPPARPGDDSEGDEVMVEGRSRRTERHASPSQRCQTFPGQPCVSADTFEDSLAAPGAWSRPDPPSSPRAVPEPCRQGGDPRCDLAGPLRSPASPDSLSQAHPLPCPLPKPKSNYPSRRLSRPPQTQTIPLTNEDKQPQPRFL